MPRRISLFVVMAAALFAAACNSSKEIEYGKPVFKEESSGKFEILTGKPFWGGVPQLFEYRDLLAVVACEETKPTNTWLHIFDKQGNRLSDLICVGRGPKEIIGIIAAGSYMVRDTIFMFDYFGHKVVKVDMSKVLTDSTLAYKGFPFEKEQYLYSSYSVCGGNTLNYYAIFTKPGAKKSENSHRFVLKNPQGAVVSTLDDNPLEVYPEIRYDMEVGQAWRNLSPDGKHLAIAFGFGAILETYNMEKGIRQESVSYFVKPEAESHNGLMRHTEKTIMGFNGLSSSNEMIFSSYDGETRIEGSKNKKLLFTKIAVFDWKGHPLRVIDTDYRIESVCYDKAEDTFYAVLSDIERNTYLGKMKNPK